MSSLIRARYNLLGFVLVVAVLLPVYLSTLQTLPNGAEHYYMIDVGETQIVLNTWGTLHATGYPLYVMSGNLLVAALRLLGVAPATAPGAVSLLWGILALALIYTLALRLFSPTSQQISLNDNPDSHNAALGTGNLLSPQSSILSRLMAAALTILFGLTRTVWIHNVIAEIYSFGLVFLALLLVIALWQSPIRGRIYWLALLGGLGLFHHRALIMVAPALVYAIWPELIAFLFSPSRRSRLHKILITRYSSLITILLLGLIGFLPYLYLPLRARAGAAWVYGEPGTWAGFWDQFLGREASRFVGPPRSLEALAANVNLVNTVLVTDVTVPGILLGLVGLAIAVRSPARRRTAITLLLSGAVAYGFHSLLYSDILSALILPITLSLAFGWLFLAVAIFAALKSPLSTQSSVLSPQSLKLMPHASYLLPAALFAVILITQNQPFIQDLTRDPTGLETIALARGTPYGATLMLDWGPRHFAVGFARDVLGELPFVRLVSHKADFKVLAGQAKLVTPDFTFYNRPVSWWEAQLGGTVYLNAAAPHLVEIRTWREMSPAPLVEPLAAVEQNRVCTADSIRLWVAWGAAAAPARDLSVFVHLLDASGTVIAQADATAPVYGWRPLTTWSAGELVRDVYPLPRLTNGVAIRFGLYRQLETGEFQNELVYEMPVECDA